MTDKIVIRSPRSFVIFLFQYMAIVPFGTAFALILLPLLSESSNNIFDILILSSIIIPLLIVGFLLLYFPQKNKTNIIYNKEKNILEKIKKNTIILSCDLNTIKTFILKNIKKDIGVESKVILENRNGDFIVLYNEKSYFGYNQWDVFAERLSTVTGLPLNKVTEGIKIKS